MPTLVLLRHARAEGQRLDDHSRTLAPRGRADAIAVREWLQGRGIQPDRVVISTAARARETWQLTDPGSADLVYDERVYAASTWDLREVIAETAAEVRTLVVVGHNPAIERLAWELDDSEQARHVTDGGMPTSAVAVFTVVAWAELSDAVLQEVVVLRG